MKLKVLQLLTSKSGPVIIPLISSIVGTLVAMFYAWLGTILNKFPIIEKFINDVWNGLEPTYQAGFDPKNIGIIVAGACWILIQTWLNNLFVNEVKNDQRSINQILPIDERIVVDGIPLEKTQKAKEKVNELVLGLLPDSNKNK